MKISIVTICLNNEHLERTIQSVLLQKFTDYEYIIVDGGSTNAVTVNALEKYQSGHNIIIIAERDNGRYDAMNKGILKAKGEYIVFLNAGDYFYSKDTLSQFDLNCEDRDIVYGDLEFIHAGGNIVREYPATLSYRFFLEDSLPHPAAFIRRSAFQRVGLYDSTLAIVADWAFFILALCKYNLSYKHIAYTFSSFDDEGISSQPGSDRLIEQEKAVFLKNNFPLFITDYAELQHLRKSLVHLQNSRLRKYLAVVFKQLRLSSP